MRSFAALAVAIMMLASTSEAVTWRVVTASVVVNQGGAAVTKTTLSSKKYIEEGARRFGDPNLKNYFIGFRTDTGVIAVVHIPSETVVYNVVSGLTTQGTAANAANTIGTVAGNATVSSLNTDFNGFFFDKFTRKTTGALNAVARVVHGGSGTQTLIGTFRLSAKTFEL